MHATATLPSRLNTPTSTQARPRSAAAPVAGTSTSLLGKYRVIIIAVGFFLLFDLGVLVLNFYTSYQIAEDAIGINLAGRQRMLSQRTAKAIVLAEAARTHAADATAELQELGKAADLFDQTLQSFESGGKVAAGDGKPIFVQAVQSPQAQAILAKARRIWTPYQQLIAPVLTGRSTDDELQAAGNYARANNLALLGLMNDLTSALETVASDRATTLRLVQTGGIVLALLNFGFILFKFLGQLKASDASIEAANEENREILSSVREGLFLITPEFRLGTQVSASARGLFGRDLAPGDSFFEILAPLVAPAVMTNVQGYLGLLFAPHIKAALVQDINPLQQVDITTQNRLAHSETRQLSFHFNRVQENGVVRHLLVTVQDISDRKVLEDKLKSERQQSQKEFNLLLKAFDTDPAMLRQFVVRSEVGLLEVNDLLRSLSSARNEHTMVTAVDMAFRRIHAIKGDAATLGLQTLAEQVHAFESELARIRDSGLGADEMGQSLLALPMPLEDLLEKIATLKNLSHSRRASTAPGHTHSPASLNTALAQLVQTIATDTGKQVAPEMRMDLQDQLPAKAQDLVREITEQLIRNAVVHGIETADQRASADKNRAGLVQAQLFLEAGQWCLRVRDDGAGLSAQRIRQKLLDKSWYTPAQLENFSDTQIVGHIFKPGFTTVAHASVHGGRGVGLDLVYANAQQLGAHLQLNSTPGRFTEFIIRFET